MKSLVSALTIVFGFASLVSAQSLAEVAKKEKEQKKKVEAPSKREFTENNLRGTFGPPAQSSTVSNAAAIEETVIPQRVRTVEPLPPDPTFVEVRLLEGHVTSITQVAFAPDGRTVAAATNTGSVRVWDAATGQPVSMRQHQGNITELRYSDDSQHLFFGGPGAGIQRWTYQTNRLTTAVDDRAKDAAGLFHLAVAPKAQHALSGPWWVKEPDASELPPVVLWDLNTGQPLKRWKIVKDYGTDVALTPDGRTAVVSSTYASNTETPIDCHLQAWDVETDKELLCFKAPGRSGVTLTKCSADGRYLYTVGPRTSETRIWDLRSGKELSHREFSVRAGAIKDLAPAAGRHIAAAVRSYGNESSLAMLDLETGKELARYVNDDLVFKEVIAVSPDGETVAAVTQDQVVRLYRLDLH